MIRTYELILWPLRTTSGKKMAKAEQDENNDREFAYRVS